ncbi:hypothetical protein [Natranaerofaba carboxydovora]|uniref:hypothetical protein n=1 Tax=Natranaerofaba carboxydovora TaxID=2742683 RepID=UPI001F12ABB9|nr:hypothetical protein [Natranaerofaba carboxydovora]
MFSIFVKLKDFYNRKYILTESLSFVFFGLLFGFYSLYLTGLSKPLMLHYVLLLIFVLLGITWAILCASIIGKGLFAGIIILSFFQYENILILFISLLVIFRLFLLWYIPKDKTPLSTSLSRFELFNRQVDSKEIFDINNMVKKRDIELITRVIASGFVDINNFLGQAVQKEDNELIEIFLKMGADPLEEFDNENLVKKAIIKKDRDLLEKIISGDFELSRDSKRKESSAPMLKVVFYDELKKERESFEKVSGLENFNNIVSPLDPFEDYMLLLQKDLDFWLDKLHKLFNQNIKISSKKAGYLFVVSKHQYIRNITKEKKISREKEELVSMPVGLLRVKDELEDTLQNSFFPVKNGSYTFPFEIEELLCNKCDGRGLKNCPSGCDVGKVDCSNLECEDGYMKCFECNGIGRIQRSCLYCSGGYKKCGLCDGKGFLGCDNCEGRGSIVVEIMEKCPCKTEWMTKCPECEGEGRQKGYICPLCSGDGAICNECHNRGQRPGEKTTEMSCNKCDETGKIGTCRCQNGEIRCDNCNGAGIENKQCEICSGSGVTRCVICKGTKKENCKTCGGFGRVSCSYCEGTGKMYETNCANFEYLLSEKTSGQFDFIFLDDNSEIFDEMAGISPRHIDGKYRGSTDLIRVVFSEGLNDLNCSFLELNSFVEKNKTDEPGVVMEVIDILPVKYDIIELTDGDRIVVFNERDLKEKF